MKNIFRYLGAVLALGLAFSATSCVNEEDLGSADLGLTVKVFSPTKVIAGMPMTINGSGFANAEDPVVEVEFPGEVKVTALKIVTDGMIRLTAPKGIDKEGGKIIVRTATAEAESPLPLTIGNPSISGYSVQADGETVITGGDQLTIFGSDLEFIDYVELMDKDGNPLIVEDESFYRKGTSNVVIIIPRNIYDGAFAGKVYTVDGNYFTMPEFIYAPPSDGGHFETVETVIWTNPDPDGVGAVNWNGVYRFAPESNPTGEEIYTVPQDIWEKMKTEKFYMLAKGSDWIQMRIVTGWWNNQWPDGNDITTGNEMIIDNGDGTYYIELDLSGSDLAGAMDAEHLLFTGSGYTPLELYFQETVWVGEGGNDGPGEIDIAPFTMYQDRSDYVSYPFYPSWSDDTGKWRIMRGGDPAIETLGVTTSSKFIVYKEVGTTGQLQWNDPNWGTFAGVECNDWDGSAETIEVPVTEDMLKCITGETADGWSDTAIIIQGDGLTVTKIALVL